MMQPPQSSTGELSDYTKDLTAVAELDALDPVIGREKEISRMIQVLSRKRRITQFLWVKQVLVRRHLRLA